MEWISVKDRLPDQEDEILKYFIVARNIDRITTICCYFLDGKFYCNNYGMNVEFKNPTHWMPLPVPPEEKQ